MKKLLNLCLIIFFGYSVATWGSRSEELEKAVKNCFLHGVMQEDLAMSDLIMQSLLKKFEDNEQKVIEYFQKRKKLHEQREQESLANYSKKCNESLLKTFASKNDGSSLQESVVEFFKSIYLNVDYRTLFPDKDYQTRDFLLGWYLKKNTPVWRFMNHVVDENTAISLLRQVFFKITVEICPQHQEYKTLKDLEKCDLLNAYMNMIYNDPAAAITGGAVVSFGDASLRGQFSNFFCDWVEDFWGYGLGAGTFYLADNKPYQKEALNNLKELALNPKKFKEAGRSISNGSEFLKVLVEKDFFKNNPDYGFTQDEMKAAYVNLCNYVLYRDYKEESPSDILTLEKSTQCSFIPKT